MSELSTLKDLIQILGPRKSFIEISKKLHGIVSVENIAFCIFKTCGECPLCNRNQDKCPICSSDTTHLIEFCKTRVRTFQQILKIIQVIWNQEVLHKKE